MSDEEKQEAAELARKSAREARAAAKDAARAAKVVAEPVIDAAADEVQDTVHKLEGTAEDAARSARKIDPMTVSDIAQHTGWGFLALSVSVYAAIISGKQFRSAFEGRKYLMAARSND